MGCQQLATVFSWRDSDDEIWGEAAPFVWGAVVEFGEREPGESRSWLVYHRLLLPFPSSCFSKKIFHRFLHKKMFFFTFYNSYHNFHIFKNSLFKDNTPQPWVSLERGVRPYSHCQFVSGALLLKSSLDRLSNFATCQIVDVFSL